MKFYRVEHPAFIEEVGAYFTVGNVLLVRDLDLTKYLEPVKLSREKMMPAILSEVKTNQFTSRQVAWREEEK